MSEKEEDFREIEDISILRGIIHQLRMSNEEYESETAHLKAIIAESTRTATIFKDEGWPTLKYRDGPIPREIDAVPCQCGGYMGRVESTQHECDTHGCRRDRPGSECCARSFVCIICGARYATRAQAPEMGY